MAEEHAMEELAAWMTQHGFATGHGDNVADLLDELTWQLAEIRQQRDALRSQLSPFADLARRWVEADGRRTPGEWVSTTWAKNGTYAGNIVQKRTDSVNWPMIATTSILREEQENAAFIILSTDPQLRALMEFVLAGEGK